MTKNFLFTTHDNKKNGGFTLAEVLITLGIIGVVAAMTIPTLIKNYQKTVWVNQLKKSVSTLEQGFQKMLADEGVDSFKDTELGLLCKSLPYYASGDDDGELTEHTNILKKYFKIINANDKTTEGDNKTFGSEYNGTAYKLLYGEREYSGDGAIKLYMNDGTVFGFRLFFDNANYRYIDIDVNGDEKKPNQWGRDSFKFILTDNMRLIPVGSKNYDKMFENNGNKYWKNSDYYCSVNGNYSSGDGCAARIIENGWKMDY